MFAIMRTKTVSHHRKIPRLMLEGSPGQSTGASPPSSPSVSSSPTPAASATPAPTPSLALALSRVVAVVMKEEEETMASAAGIITLAPEGPESSVPLKGVIELSDDESEGLIASFTATANTGPFDASPSTPRVPAVPDTSGD